MQLEKNYKVNKLVKNVNDHLKLDWHEYENL